MTYGLPVVIVRPSNNFGPYQYPEKFIPLFVTNALEGKPLPLYGQGTNVRDWLFVEDNCRAIELAARRGAAGEAYNVGAGNEVQNIEVAERICDLLGKGRDLIKLVPDRLGHDRRYAVDWGKIRGLGWAPETNSTRRSRRPCGGMRITTTGGAESRTAAATSRPFTSITIRTGNSVRLPPELTTRVPRRRLRSPRLRPCDDNVRRHQKTIPRINHFA